MAFKVSRSGIGLILVAAFGIMFTAMPLMGLGADISPDADTYLEQRYGNIGIGLALMFTALMVVVALVGVIMQFRPRAPRQSKRRR